MYKSYEEIVSYISPKGIFESYISKSFYKGDLKEASPKNKKIYEKTLIKINKKTFVFKIYYRSRTDYY